VFFAESCYQSSRRNDQIQDPKAIIFVAFDSLVITKDSHAVSNPIKVNVNVSLLKEVNRSVNRSERWQGDGDGKAGCHAIGNGGEEFFFHGATMGNGAEGVKIIFVFSFESE
jgi:hypothetical protein